MTRKTLFPFLVPRDVIDRGAWSGRGVKDLTSLSNSDLSNIDITEYDITVSTHEIIWINYYELIMRAISVYLLHSMGYC